MADIERKDEEVLYMTPKAKSNVYVHSKEHAWLPARVLESNETEARVQVFEPNEQKHGQGESSINGSRSVERVVQLKDYPENSLPLQNVNECGDMIDLPFLHEVRGPVWSCRESPFP
jgi:hypothetical protein